MMEQIATILEDAGRNLLLPAFSRLNKAGNRKADGSPVTETDLACQKQIRSTLFGLWPEITFLGEEMAPEEQQACLDQSSRYWCLDPLDGTSNFIASFPVFALSLALVEEGTPTLACIHDPVRQETFSAQVGNGSHLNGAAVRTQPADELGNAVGFIDFKRLDATRRMRLSSPGIYRSQRNIGTCALEWAWLAAGRGQFIVHGGEKLWDYAAGALIAAEAGCVITDFGGDDIFSQTRLSSSIVAAASPPLHRAFLELIGMQT